MNASDGARIRDDEMMGPAAIQYPKLGCGAMYSCHGGGAGRAHRRDETRPDAAEGVQVPMQSR